MFNKQQWDGWRLHKQEVHMLRFSAHRTSAVVPLCQVGPRGWEEANFVFCSVAGFKWGSSAGRPTNQVSAGRQG